MGTKKLIRRAAAVLTMGQDPVDERGSHHVVAEDFAPLLEALVGGEHGRGVLVAAIHKLEEQHGASVADGQIADLIDHQQRRMGENGQSGGLAMKKAAKRARR